MRVFWKCTYFAILIIALYCIASWSRLAYYYSVEVAVNQTLVRDYVQQYALYEECMSLTYHTKAGHPVNRILGRPLDDRELHRSP